MHDQTAATSPTHALDTLSIRLVDSDRGVLPAFRPFRFQAPPRTGAPRDRHRVTSIDTGLRARLDPGVVWHQPVASDKTGHQRRRSGR